MADSPDFERLQAEIANLHRRLAHLEVTMGEDARHGYGTHELLSLYIETRMGTTEPTRKNARLWSLVVQRMDEVCLLELARYLGDPFPWRTFLVVIDQLSTHTFDPFTQNLLVKAQEHLLEVAENLLRIQRLDVLRPRDVLLSPIGIERAISTYQRVR